jgi:hypothetical protein
VNPQSGEFTPYQLPTTRRLRGGINSLVIVQNWLFGTHSELGLLRWNLDKPHQPAVIYHPELTQQAHTVRGVCSYRQKIIFAVDNALFVIDQPEKNKAPEKLGTLPDAITALKVISGFLFAGHASATRGGVHIWQLHGNRSSTALPVRGPVQALDAVALGNKPCLVYVIDGPIAYAQLIGGKLELIFEGATVGLQCLVAGSDIICAAGGHMVLLWNFNQPAEPQTRIDISRLTAHPIYDICSRTSLTPGGQE